MPWFITKLVDRGPKYHYRYHVEGVNTEGQKPCGFCWDVPNLTDPAYRAHTGASEDVARLLVVAKVVSAPRAPSFLDDDERFWAWIESAPAPACPADAPSAALRPWRDMTAGKILAAMNMLVDGLPTFEEMEALRVGADRMRAHTAAMRAARLSAHRPCLACAREACAQAGYGGIDREQPGHTCAAYTLDGEVVVLEEFIQVNTAPGTDPLPREVVEEIRHLMPGDSLLLGGGAGETFTLKRTR